MRGRAYIRDFTIIEKNIYWIDWYTPTIFETSACTGVSNPLYTLDLDEIEDGAFYNIIEMAENKVIFLPGGASCCVIYDWNKNNIQELNIEDEKNSGDGFYIEAILNNNDIVLFPRNNVNIECIHIESDVQKVWTGEASGVRFVNPAACVGQYCFFVDYSKKYIIKYDLMSHKCETVKPNIMYGLISGIEMWNERIVCADIEKKKIYCMSELGEISNVINMPYDFELNNKTEIKFLRVDDEIWVFTYGICNHLYRVNIKENTMEMLPYTIGKQNALVAKIYGGEVVFFSENQQKFYFIDTQTKDIRSIDIEYSDESVSELKEQTSKKLKCGNVVIEDGRMNTLPFLMEYLGEKNA